MRTEKRIHEIFNTAYDMVCKADIVPGKITSVKINRRLKRSIGRCIERCDDGYSTYFEIEFNKVVFSDKISDKDVTETAVHEILHSCENSMCYTGAWLENARIFMDKYPEYTISRCANFSNITLNDLGYKDHKYRIYDNGVYAITYRTNGNAIYAENCYISQNSNLRKIEHGLVYDFADKKLHAITAERVS